MTRTFHSNVWGTVAVQETKYARGGALAIQLWIYQPEEGLIVPLAKLSVNLPESAALPPNCFYVKCWSENARIAMDAAASGWFKRRDDIRPAFSGHVVASAWELLPAKGEPFNLEGE